MSATLVSDAAVIAALETAHEIRFSAYVLQRNSALAPVLEAAGDRGARVDVLLDARQTAGAMRSLWSTRVRLANWLGTGCTFG